MLNLSKIHHIAIICSDYDRSKKFYTEILGLKILKETFRAERSSYKLDLGIGDQYVIELFSFPDPPERVSHPEATGLRHLAFATPNLEETVQLLRNSNIEVEPVRKDEITGKLFTFIADPDGLPLEFYEH